MWWFVTSACNFFILKQKVCFKMCKQYHVKQNCKRLLETLPFPFSSHFTCAVLQGCLSHTRMMSTPRLHVYSYNNANCSGTSSSRVIQYTIRVQRGLIALQNGYLFLWLNPLWECQTSPCTDRNHASRGPTSLTGRKSTNFTW